MKWSGRRLTWLAAVWILLAGCEARAGVTISDSWAEAGGSGPNAAIYLIIANGSNATDTLESVASTACGSAEIHITTLDSQGIMRMEPLPGNRLLLPARSETALQPGGMHIMCFNKTGAFAPGANIALTLRFALAGEQTISVPVKP